MRSFGCLFLVLSLASSLKAQATLGSAAVGGTVRDNTGASVPDARVTLREIARGLDRDTITNQSGNFLFPTVPPGEFSLRITKAGFDAEEVRSFNLDVGQRASFDMELNVGQISTVVSVDAGNRALLETESNAIGTVVDSARVQGLPLNGRNFLQLALLSGGVVEPTTHSDSIQGQIGRSGRAVVLAGNLGGSTGYLINGISTRGGRLGESALNLSVSSVDQFKIQLSFFMPDEGPNPGLVNITTKGGTNGYHGEAFEFLRNGVFDARNFFAPAPENLHRNQFGFAVGGPVVKDKLWFFGNHEGLREITAFSASGYAPTGAMFAGNFAEIPQRIFDPQTFDAATGTRQPFPGNIIPANRINPVAAKLLPYYLPGSSLAQRPANLFGNPRNRLNDDQYGVRIDSSITPTQNLFGQFIHQNDPAVQPGLEPLSGARFPAEAQLAMVQHTWSLRPTLVNTIRLGFVRNLVFQSGEAQSLGHVLGGIGIANTLDDRGISGISVQGFQGFGRSAGDLGNVDNNYQLDEGLNYVKGSHNYQFGVSLRYRRTIQQNSNANALGSLGFQPTFTAQLAPNGKGQLAPAANSGNAFGDFLLGIPTTGQLIGLPRLPYRYTQYMPYFEDTWKVTRNFTLNYGISWFLATVPEPQGSAEKLPHGFDYRTGLLKFAALGEVDPRILTMAKTNFTPRFGFAWKPSFLPNTVIRSGAGVYYSDTRLIELQFAMVAPPFNSPQVVNNSPTSPLPQYVLGTNVFPPAPNLPLDKNYAASLPAGTSAFLLNPNGKNPYVTQWNFSIQHSIRSNDAIEIVYLGSSGHRQQDRYETAECRPARICFAIRPPSRTRTTAACLRRIATATRRTRRVSRSSIISPRAA